MPMCSQGAVINPLCQSDRRTRAARQNSARVKRVVIGRPAATLAPILGSLHSLNILTEFSSHYLAGHRHGPRAHADRHAFHQQTKNRIQANLVTFSSHRGHIRYLILDLFEGQLIVDRLICSHSLSCAFDHSSPLARPSYAIV